MCTQIATHQTTKLAELIDRLADLPEPAYSQVLKHLLSPAVTSLPDEDRVLIWEALKDIALKHRKFADAKWALSEELVIKLEEVASRLAPKALKLVNRRLFTESEFKLYEEKTDYEKERQRLDHLRQDAIEDILSTEGIDGVIRFAQNVESPRKVGNALGAIEDSKIDAFLLPAFLNHNERAINQFLSNFVLRRFWTQDWTWVDLQLNQSWQIDQITAFLLLLPFEKQTWQRADKILGDEASSYWKHVLVNPWGLEPDDLLEAAEKLTLNGQPASAIDCLYLLVNEKVPIPMPLASDALLGTLSIPDQQKMIDLHHIVEVIKWLQNNASTNLDDLFKIEWNYLPLLNRLHGGEPKVLEYKLASSPEFFCEVIAAVFRSDKEDEEKETEISDIQKRIAQNVYSLLHGWRILPGSIQDGSYDGGKFKEWLDEVKRRCEKSGHFRVAMSQLGQALAYAPKDPEGLWIHKSIATALDRRDIPEIRRAFTTGLFNKRDVHHFSHGEEELKIATDYRAKAKALSDNGFHRVADAVRRLAEQYERDAERELQRDILDDW